jgi:hypothetical protein
MSRHSRAQSKEQLERSPRSKIRCESTRKTWPHNAFAIFTLCRQLRGESFYVNLEAIMAPRILSDQWSKLPEKCARLAPLDPEPDPKAPSRFDGQINPRWLRINAAVKYSGINRSRLFKLIAEGAVRTASLKEHRGAKRGLRLIDRFSLDLFLETLAKPVEERLVQEANELRLEEEALSKEQELLAQKQRTVSQQLAKIRKQNSRE